MKNGTHLRELTFPIISICRNFGFILFLLFHSFHSFSQVPQGIPYQAVIRTAGGVGVPNQTDTYIFSIQDGSNWMLLYQEQQVLTTNNRGLVTAIIGAGNVIVGNFSSIDWGSGPKWLGVQKGNEYLGNSEMQSVPFALHSQNADSSLFALQAGYAQSAQTALAVQWQLSETGDTLHLGNGDFLIIPGASGNATPILGCTDQAACNYNYHANTDDASCYYIHQSCDDGNVATHYDTVNTECQCSGILSIMGQGVTDIDGNFYPSIIFNNQEWMQKNLKVTRFNNGDEIANIETTQLDNNGYYPNIPMRGNPFVYNEILGDALGRYYNQLVVKDTRNVCPMGWRVPTYSDFDELRSAINFDFGMLKTVGSIEMGTGLWRYPNVGATNLIGWNAFPNSSGDQTAYYLDYNDNNVNSDDGFIMSSQHNGYNDGPIYFFLFPELINLPQPYNKMAFIRCIKE